MRALDNYVVTGAETTAPEEERTDSKARVPPRKIHCMVLAFAASSGAVPTPATMRTKGHGAPLATRKPCTSSAAVGSSPLCVSAESMPR